VSFKHGVPVTETASVASQRSQNNDKTQVKLSRKLVAGSR